MPRGRAARCRVVAAPAPPSMNDDLGSSVARNPKASRRTSTVAQAPLEGKLVLAASALSARDLTSDDDGPYRGAYSRIAWTALDVPIARFHRTEAQPMRVLDGINEDTALDWIARV